MFKKTISGVLSVLLCASALTVAPSAYAAEADTESKVSASVADFDGENNITLKVWAPDRAVALVKKQVNNFKSLYSSKTFRKIEVVAQGTGDSGTMVLNDPSAAADVFIASSDMLHYLADSYSLNEVRFSNDVKSRNEANAVKAATENDTLYGYPLTCDNGYYLVYDKRVVSDESAKTLESTLAACQRKGRKFIYDTSNGFYSCAMAFTAGLVIDGYEADGSTQKFNLKNTMKQRRLIRFSVFRV